MSLFAPSELFVTPDSVKDLQERVESYNGGERIAATMGMMMTWNLCAKIERESKPTLGIEIHVVSYDPDWDTFHVECQGSAKGAYAMPSFALAMIDPDRRFLEQPEQYVGLTFSI